MSSRSVLIQALENDSAFCKQPVVYQTKEERLKKYLNLFSLDENEIIKEYQKFVKAIPHCLVDKGEKYGMKFLETYIVSSSSGEERGKFYAIDFGGSNFRIIECELLGNGEYVAQSKSLCIDDIANEVPYPKGYKDKDCSATVLFNRIAQLCKDFMIENGDYDHAITYQKTYYAGFTFSFAIDQYSLNSGSLLEWDKEFETGRNTDDDIEQTASIVDFMNEAFIRLDVPIKVIALLNDTTGTLLASSYLVRGKYMQSCPLAVIIGTGLNVCYAERQSKQYGYHGIVINTECGNYNQFKKNIIDLQVDSYYVSAGLQSAEKMISGAYIGEIFRRTLIRIFRHETPKKLWYEEILQTKDCCEIAYDESNDYCIIKQIFREKLKCTLDDVNSLEIIKKVAQAVLKRSARLVAIIICAFAKRTGKLQPAVNKIHVGIDGSLYRKNFIYQQELQEGITNIIGAKLAKHLNLQLVEDGSGIGAAILASCLDVNKLLKSYSYYN